MPPPSKRLRISPRAEPRTRPVWQDVFLAYPIYSRICSYLTRHEIITLSSTCKELQVPVIALLKSQWDFNKLLTRFVDDPVGLRQKIADADALISGSFALQFFEGTVWREADLDIYVQGMGWALNGVEEEEGPGSLCTFLVEVEGCRLTKTMETEEYDGQVLSISGVKTFTRINSEGCDVDIQVILTIKKPLLMILTSFYTTCLISFISWDCAYHVFPDVTFIKRKTYQLRNMTPFYGNLLKKYSRRGWRTLDTVWNDDEEHTKSLIFAGERRVGDERSWTIPLNTDGIKPPNNLNTSNIPFSFFGVADVHAYQDYRERYEVFTREFESCVLKQKYLYPRCGSDDSFWYAMGERLENLTAMEIDKQATDWNGDFAQGGRDDMAWLKEEEVLGTYFMQAMRVRESPLEGWTWWDDEVSKWYEAWSKKKLVLIKKHEV